jgi:hypothetical protein
VGGVGEAAARRGARMTGRPVCNQNDVAFAAWSRRRVYNARSPALAGRNPQLPR